MVPSFQSASMRTSFSRKVASAAAVAGMLAVSTPAFAGSNQSAHFNVTSDSTATSVISATSGNDSTVFQNGGGSQSNQTAHSDATASTGVQSFTLSDALTSVNVDQDAPSGPSNQDAGGQVHSDSDATSVIFADAFNTSGVGQTGGGYQSNQNATSDDDATTWVNAVQQSYSTTRLRLRQR